MARHHLPLIALLCCFLNGSTHALANDLGCDLSFGLAGCKPFGTAPKGEIKTNLDHPIRTGNSRNENEEESHVGKTTNGGLKINRTPERRVSNYGEPIKMTGKPLVTKVISNAGMPIRQTGKPAAGH